MDQNNLIDLFVTFQKLKTLKRSGWIEKGIKDPESVADHSFLVTLIALIMGENLNLDIEKLLIMSILHDIPEIITGDITPSANISKKDKLDKEERSIKKLFSSLDNSDFFMKYWHEYNDEQTEESKLLKSIDKLEMAVQASVYDEKYKDINFKEFFESALSNASHRTVTDLIQILNDRNNTN